MEIKLPTVISYNPICKIKEYMRTPHVCVTVSYTQLKFWLGLFVYNPCYNPADNDFCGDPDLGWNNKHPGRRLSHDKSDKYHEDFYSS